MTQVIILITDLRNVSFVLETVRSVILQVIYRARAVGKIPIWMQLLKLFQENAIVSQDIKKSNVCHNSDVSSNVQRIVQSVLTIISAANADHNLSSRVLHASVKLKMDLNLASFKAFRIAHLAKRVA